MPRAETLILHECGHTEQHDLASHLLVILSGGGGGAEKQALQVLMLHHQGRPCSACRGDRDDQ